MLGPDKFILVGKSAGPDGHYHTNLIVRVYALEMMRDKPLAEIHTDEQGRYAFDLTNQLGAPKPSNRPRLAVRTYTTHYEPVSEEVVIYGFDTDTVTQPTVIVAGQSAMSEFQEIAATLAPWLKERPPAKLSEAKIEALLNRLIKHSDLDDPRMRVFLESMAIAREADLPAELVYGIARVRHLQPPLRIASFAAIDSSSAHKILLQAVEERIVSNTHEVEEFLHSSERFDDKALFPADARLPIPVRMI